MRAPLTVLTASIPGREQLLAEAIESVYAQTVEVHSHLVMAQSCTEGLAPPHHVAEQRNEVLAAVRTDWVANLNDDDLWLPHHVATVLPYFDDAEVIYTWDESHALPRVDCTDWAQSKLIERLDAENFIDSNALIRMDALEGVQGWPTDWPYDSRATYEDWELWRRLAALDAKFVCVPVETWRYRTGDWDRITAPLEPMKH